MVRGNLAACLSSMGKLERMLDDLSQLPRKVAVEAAPQINALIQKQFAGGFDPYGRKWKGLAASTKKRGRKNPPLTASGKLKKGTKTSPLSGGRAGLRIVVGRSYGIFHQTGTKHMPARKILPERGMPKTWSDILVQSAQKVARQALGKVR